MHRPFSGNGIPKELNVNSSQIVNDSYYKLLNEILNGENILNKFSIEDTKKLQKKLLYPYLEFFLRNEKKDFYKKLFYSRGIAKNEKGELKDNLELTDLIKLRIHSDDLRGDGQKKMILSHYENDVDNGMNFLSSGTSDAKSGPVNVFRSHITLSLSRKTNGNLIDWAMGKKINTGECLFHMAPEMTNFLAFAAIGSDFLRDRGLEVSFGAKVNDGPPDTTIWQKLGPDIRQMKKFFRNKNDIKYFIASGVGLYKMFIEPKGLKKMSMKLILGAPPVFLGNEGVLMIGGGLKRLPPEVTSLSQVVKATGEKIISGFNKNDKPAPVIDLLGLTESINVFIGVPTSPFSEDPWVKYPHPLTYSVLLKSPYDLTPVLKPVPGEEYLLFYVNFMTLDYLEAIVPGDFVLATESRDSIQTYMGERNISQQGFIYSRRAETSEGFKIREGCG